MNRYALVISEEAQVDLRTLSDVISYQYKAPLTAIRYLDRIYFEIKKLSHSAESFTIQTRTSFHQYGPNPRMITCEKMAIIYNLINNVVYIRRVIPSSSIAGL